MVSEEIKIGNVVQLNSGSPDLTVVSIGNGRCSVTWDNGTGALDSAEFPLACVKLVPTGFIRIEGGLSEEALSDLKQQMLKANSRLCQ